MFHIKNCEMGCRCNGNNMGKRAVRLAQIFWFLSIYFVDILHAFRYIRYCAQNNIGNIIRYHSIHIISIIQCRFNITRWASTLLRTVLIEIAKKHFLAKCIDSVSPLWVWFRVYNDLSHSQRLHLLGRIVSPLLSMLYLKWCNFTASAKSAVAIRSAAIRCTVLQVGAHCKICPICIGGRFGREGTKISCLVACAVTRHGE